MKQIKQNIEQQQTRTINTYISNKIEQRACCTRKWFLLLKLCYSDTGLTNEEYNEYKQLLD